MNQGTHNIALRLEHNWTAERKIDFVCDWFDVSVSLDCISTEYGVPIRRCQEIAVRLGCPKRRVIRANLVPVVVLEAA